jgi:hypothetical protein
MLLLPEGQTGEAWEHSNMQDSSENREYWREKYFHFFPIFRGLLSNLAAH